MDKTSKPLIDPIPSRLYKYRCWADKFHRRMLTHNAVYFASARKFNDPFDCTIPVEVGQVADAFMEKRISRRVRKDYPTISEREFDQKVRHWMGLKLWKDPANLKRVQVEFQESKYDQGIFGLSEPRDNLLMWSHYADSHKGFCVGFDTSRLKAYFDRLAESDSITIFSERVEYQTDYPEFSFYGMTDQELYLKPLITKSTIWEYEQEFRFIAADKADVQLAFDNGAIVEVIIGCEIPDEHRAEIKDILRDKGSKVELFEARMKEKSFGLDFIPIDY